MIVTIGTFWIVWKQLSDTRWVPKGSVQLNLRQGLGEVVRSNPHLKKWLVITAISQLPLGMVLPFTQVFAYSVKGAQERTLGAMVTASALASIALAIPLGRWADRIGRKKVLYLIMPLFWLSNLLLIWAPSPVFLVIAGALQGFFFIGSSMSAAMERELVPAAFMGRWVGITRFCKMFLSGLLALPAGILWDKLGPQYIFLIYVGIDALIQLPLLISMPETLHLRHRSEPAGKEV